MTDRHNPSRQPELRSHRSPNRGPKFRSFQSDERPRYPRDSEQTHHDEHTKNYRGELCSLRLKNQAGNSYFLNLKENREADIYLNIVESYNQQKLAEGESQQYSNAPTFKRHSILIFAEQRQAFATKCLAALEALAQGQSFQAQVESIQRQFIFQVQQQGHQPKAILTIRENSQHYGKPLQQQLRISQDCASSFSQAFIEVIEKWLEYEKQKSGPHTANGNLSKQFGSISNHSPSRPKTGHKKVVALPTPISPDDNNFVMVPENPNTK